MRFFISKYVTDKANMQNGWTLYKSPRYPSTGKFQRDGREVTFRSVEVAKLIHKTGSWPFKPSCREAKQIIVVRYISWT